LRQVDDASFLLPHVLEDVRISVPDLSPHLVGVACRPSFRTELTRSTAAPRTNPGAEASPSPPIRVRQGKQRGSFRMPLRGRTGGLSRKEDKDGYGA
jgi:hypothetical protein